MTLQCKGILNQYQRKGDMKSHNQLQNRVYEEKGMKSELSIGADRNDSFGAWNKINNDNYSKHDDPWMVQYHPSNQWTWNTKKQKLMMVLTRYSIWRNNSNEYPCSWHDNIILKHLLMTQKILTSLTDSYTQHTQCYTFLLN